MLVFLIMKKLLLLDMVRVVIRGMKKLSNNKA